jgi:hypothetical protein
MYDSLSGRWIAVIATEGVRAAPALLLAVSDGTDPTRGWSFQRIPSDSAGDDAAEFPLLGANARWICLTANLISLSTGNGGGVAIWAIEKSSLLSGILTVTRFVLPDASSPIAPVVTFDADEADEYLVEQWSRNDNGRGEIEISRLTDLGGNAALRTVGTVSAPATWIDHPNPFDSLPQAQGGHPITASQDDVASACLRHGLIWAVQTATIPATPQAAPQHSVVQWWRATKSALLSGFGRIGDPSGRIWLAYPSIAVNGRDQAVIGYSIFSPDIFPSAGYSLRLAGCDGSLSEIHTLKEGDAPYVRLDAQGLNRWGDLTETAVDPADDLSLWTIQQFAAPLSAGASRWGTWWGALAPAPLGRNGACISPVPREPPAPISGREGKGPA